MSVMSGKGRGAVEFVVSFVDVLVQEFVFVHPPVDPVIGRIGAKAKNGDSLKVNITRGPGTSSLMNCSVP